LVWFLQHQSSQPFRGGKALRRSKNSIGFSLIEVLIALVILSIALLGMASLMSSATKYNASGGRLTEATTLAQDKLEILRITPWIKIGNGVDPVIAGSTGTNYSRSWLVASNADDTLKTVNLTVGWNDGVDHSVTILSAIGK
jgi:type IV pilus modification protein PilV